MKVPQWIKQYWKDPAFRATTIVLPLVAIVWDGIITLWDMRLHYATMLLVLIVLALMYVTAYLRRNSP